VGDGPVVIGYDGSPAARRAVREAGALLSVASALVVVVWEAGKAFDLMEVPALGLDLPPAGLDVRTAFAVDEAMYDQAQQLARQGAALAREAGFETAEGLAVADELTVSDTLVRVAREQDAPALVVGSHGHTALGELLVGSTSRGVLRHAGRPVVVVRQTEAR
jgi:nucleotide-binding universal stress UspA family protein